MAEEKLIGTITHYFGKIGVGIIKLTDDLSVGDRIHIQGKVSDFEQTVDSIQIEHQNIEKSEAGKEVGIKLDQSVKEGDEVYKII